MKKLFTLGLFLLLFAAIASAQGPRERINKMRVREGIRSGELTRPELRELRKNQVRYNRAQHRAHRDGMVTPLERRRLQKMRVENNRDLFRYKHNRLRRVI